MFQARVNVGGSAGIAQSSGAGKSMNGKQYSLSGAFSDPSTWVQIYFVAGVLWLGFMYFGFGGLARDVAS
jgi:hypothetical protein